MESCVCLASASESEDPVASTLPCASLTELVFVSTVVGPVEEDREGAFTPICVCGTSPCWARILFIDAKADESEEDIEVWICPGAGADTGLFFAVPDTGGPILPAVIFFPIVPAAIWLYSIT